MLLEGSVLNGSIVLDEPTAMPDGTRVRIEPILTPPDFVPTRKPIASLRAIKEKLARERENPPPPGPTLAERLKDFIGHSIDLPADAASRVDYYLEHGLPPAESPK